MPDLPELAERDAAGEIALIYDEIRRFCAVPYVSSMQRHLATRPGWLPWAWAALRPAFASGRAQTAAWRVTAEVPVPRLPPIPRAALRVWGVDAAGEVAIHAVCTSFVRVSPTNLVFSGLLRRLLDGETPSTAGDARADWTPPAALPPLPSLVDAAALPPAAREVLASLGTTVGGRSFVPGLYRMLAHWPGFLAHVATELRPRFDDPATRAACARVVDLIDAEVPALLRTLPPLPASPPAPPRAEFDEVRSALAGYRATSPEMVVFGLMIRTALPPA